MQKITLPKTTSRIDDPHVFEANDRGEMAEAQRLILSPWMVAKRVLSQPDGAPVASVMLFLPLAMMANGNLERLAASLPWLTHPTLTAWAVGIGLALFVLTPKLLWLARHIPALRRDLATSSMMKLPGTVTWEKYRFVARASDGRKIEALVDRFSAAPGPYAFYVLRESLILLSMKPISSERERDRATTSLYEKLFGFTAEDLARHARGEATTWERLRAVTSVSGLPNFFILILLLLTPIAWFIGVYVDGLLRRSEPFGPVLILASIFVLVVLGGLVFLAAIVIRCLRARIEMLEGRVHTEDASSRSRGVCLTYVLNGRSFIVSQRAFEAFVPQTSYRIYAFEGSSRLLSIEAIADTKTPPRQGAHRLQE